MRCSICISTRNKAAILERVLASIRCQQIPFEYEIVVADDGSTDNTRGVCRGYEARYLYLDNDRYRNPSRARNDAYRFATGDVIIAQSDDVVHYGGNTVRDLVAALRPGAVAIATVLNMVSGTRVPHHEPFHVYSGPDKPRAFFFLGALWRTDLYAIGGNDEDFVEPCWDDNWFEDCLVNGLKLEVDYATNAIGHHQSHGYPTKSHQREDVSRALYFKKLQDSHLTGIYTTTADAWPLEQRTIPKRMSFCWGGSTLSWMRYMTLASFRFWHPDWEMRLYRAGDGNAAQWESHEQEDATTYHGGDNYLDQVEELGIETIPWSCPVPGASVTHASDLCQWQVLSHAGGFYSDMDILYVGSIDHATAGQADVMFCLSLGYMTIGFMGASGNNPVFRAIADAAIQGYDPKAYQSTGAEAIYGLAGLGPVWSNCAEPGRLSVAYFRDHFPELRFRELPTNTVYPWNYTETSKVFAETHETPAGCIGIHWFGANPLSQAWNNILTENNFRAFTNTFTKCAALSKGSP